MPEFAHDGITLHYEVLGDGPPLLMLAGMLSDSASWAALLPHLTDHFTLICPDNRTTGRTRPWDAPAGVDLMVTDAAALMAHLGHNKYALAGHSLGGIMALELAHAHPDQVQRASILASSRGRSPRTVAVFDALMAVRRAPKGEEMWLRALYPWLFGQAFFEDPATVETALMAARAYPHAQGADAMAHQIAAFRAFRPKAKLEEISCPVQVIYAGDDLLVPPHAAKESFAALPDLSEATVEAAGHSLHWDAPEEVAGHLGAFLS